MSNHLTVTTGMMGTATLPGCTPSREPQSNSPRTNWLRAESRLRKRRLKAGQYRLSAPVACKAQGGHAA